MERKKPGPPVGQRKADRFFIFDDVMDDCVGFSMRYGIPYKTLKKRLSRGWSIERALTEPIQKRSNNINAID